MKPEVVAALEASIKHWEENAAASDLEDVTLGTNYCALCQMFHKLCCRGCPVQERTKMSYCIGTPYEDAEEFASPQTFAKFLDAARAELEFLKSLREENGGETGE